MLIEYIIDLFFNLLLWALSWLPLATFPAEVYDVLHIIRDGLNIVYLIFPIDTIMQVVLLVLTIEISIMTYKIANEIYNKSRGSGG